MNKTDQTEAKKQENEQTLTPEYIRKLIKSSVLKLGPNHSKEQKKNIMRVLIEIYEKGKTPKEAMNLTEQEMRELYHFAYNLFNAGKYSEARVVFHVLSTLEPENAEFATALGVCYHREKNYDGAIQSYLKGAFLDFKNPIPFMYCYDCYINLNLPDVAGIMLSNVITRCGDQPKYAILKERASLLLKPLFEAFKASKGIK